MSHAVHDDTGKLGPREHSADPGHLSWRQPAAGQPAQQPGLPAGARPELQEQAEPAETAQLVCPNCKGNGLAFLFFFFALFSECLQALIGCPLSSGYVLSGGEQGGAQEPGSQKRAPEE